MEFMGKFRAGGWAQGSGGGFLGSICCVLYAVAVAAGSGAGTALFGTWMTRYRPEFFLLGLIFMAGMFFRTMKKHGFQNKRVLVNHIAVMAVTFLVVSGVVGVSLALFK